MRLSARLARALTPVTALALGCERESTQPSAPAHSSWTYSTAPRASAAPAPPKASAPAAAVTTPAPARVYAKSRFVYVRPEPDATKAWLGFLWTGGAVELKSDAPRRGPGCKAFYAIEPRGYVCVDGRNATLDASDPVYLAQLPYAPKVASPWPHRYAESLGLVRYASRPTPELQRQREPDLPAQLKLLARARAGDTPPQLAGVDLTLPEQTGFDFPHLPRTVFEERRILGARSTVAYSTEARFGDRGFLLGADYSWLPKDRVKPYPVLNFRGVRLDTDAKLPLAFIRKDGRPRYALAVDGSFSASGVPFTRLAHVELTGQAQRWKQHRYFETREPGVWIREADAVVPEPRSKTPWGARLGAADTTGRAPVGRRTWIEVSIEGGWLLAFEGTRPVYATLISPGIGGMPRPDHDPVATSATRTGTYPISGKLVTVTMSSPDDLVHSDVPFVQNIVKPYALHGAYWHDNWGNPQSGGCVNLAPIDAKWLFEFSEPELPSGWHAVRWRPSLDPTTLVVLHR